MDNIIEKLSRDTIAYGRVPPNTKRKFEPPFLVIETPQLITRNHCPRAEGVRGVKTKLYVLLCVLCFAFFRGPKQYVLFLLYMSMRARCVKNKAIRMTMRILCFAFFPNTKAMRMTMLFLCLCLCESEKQSNTYDICFI